MGRQITHQKLHDPAWLKAQVDAGLTIREIAHAIGCTHTAAGDALIRYGIVHERSRIPRRPCPHCGEHFTVGTFDAHAAHCHRNPQTLAATKALLDDGDGGIVPREVYWARYHAGAPGAMSLSMLRDRYGGWGNVAAEFGLLDDEGKTRREVERELQAVEFECRVLAQDLEHGLPVCRVRQVGNETWCMLR